MNILHLTSILPAPLPKKENENDILMRIVKEYEKKYPKDSHKFIFIVPYSNKITALLKSKWEKYYTLQKEGFYCYEGRTIEVIGIPGFKNDAFVRTFLTKIGYYLNKDTIQKILINFKPDIVHAHNLRNDTEFAQILKNKHSIKYIATLRGAKSDSISKIQDRRFSPDTLMSINLILKKRYQNQIRPDIKFIPHPIDSEFFVDNVKKRNSNHFKFTSVGRLIKLKNFDKVIQALSMLKCDFIYDIYGDGPERCYLEKLSNEIGLNQFINFHGRVSHNTIKKKIKHYDLLLQPSYPEALGRVYFEAMASGVPVLAARNTGIDGLIQSGVEGFLVDHNNLDNIIRELEKFTTFSTSELLQMKNHARKNVSKYTWGKILKDYHNLYH